MKPLSLRAKITLACFSAMFIILVIMYVLVTTFYGNRLISNLDRSLQIDIASVKQSLRFQDGDLDLYTQPTSVALLFRESRNIYYQVRDTEGRPQRRSVNVIPIELPTIKLSQLPLAATIQFSGSEYRLLSTVYAANAHAGDDDLIIQVARPLKQLNENIDSLARELIILMPVPLLLVTLAGWLIATRAMQPVNTIIEKMQRINIDQLDTQLPVKQLDEIGKLSTTINDVFTRLDTAVAALKRFTADASHELRTPLTAIRTQAEVTLSHKRDSENYKDALGSILEDVEHLEYLTDTLLNLTRGDAGIIKLDKKHTDISAMLLRWLDNLQTSADTKQLIISKHIQNECYANVDASLIERVIINLLDNAIHYTPQHGEIYITLEDMSDSLMLRICDTGPGIPDADKQRIFERFVRLEQTRQTKRGSGLGLAIVDWVMQMHRGNISVNDSETGGSCFELHIPTSL